MSKHLTDSERLHIVEEYLGSPGSKRAIEKKYNITQGLIKHWLAIPTARSKEKGAVPKPNYWHSPFPIVKKNLQDFYRVFI
ncbi:hypothetical protein [Porphyromonas gulae]|uniref:hypothetical protein n=1 Tax=Porphyromonas gulae TaxID=111105 RepID=UPI000ABF2642|nr:hypothetical protein [Porphyromonas gulae]